MEKERSLVNFQDQLILIECVVHVGNGDQHDGVEVQSFFEAGEVKCGARPRT